MNTTHTISLRPVGGVLAEPFKAVSDAVVIVDELSKGRDAAIMDGLRDVIRRMELLEARLVVLEAEAISA